MSKINIKTGDLVEVIAGKDRGKRGKVVRVLRDDNKVIVEKINRIKKHRKPQYNEAGQIVEMDAPINLSNVMLFDEASKKRTRTATKVAGDKRVRISKQTGNEI